MARLRRVNPADRGWTRRRAGRGFRYLDDRGDALDADEPLVLTHGAAASTSTTLIGG